jgi:hypothetical protein
VDKITVLLGPSTVQCGVGASVSRMCSLQELIVLVSSQFPTGSLDSFNWSQGEYSNKSDFFFWKVGYQHTMNRLCTSLMQRINSVVNFTWLQSHPLLLIQHHYLFVLEERDGKLSYRMKMKLPILAFRFLVTRCVSPSLGLPAPVRDKLCYSPPCSPTHTNNPYLIECVVFPHLAYPSPTHSLRQLKGSAPSESPPNVVLSTQYLLIHLIFTATIPDYFY